MERNRRAQEESIKYREQLIKKLEEAKELTRREKEQEGELRTARRQELEAQVRPLARCAPGCRGCPVVPGHAVTAPFGLAQLAERLERAEQRCQTEEEEERAGRQRREELVRQEAERVAERGYRSRVGGSERGPCEQGSPHGARRHRAGSIVVVSGRHLSCHTAPGWNAGPGPCPSAIATRGP